jgi:hypothetical protein
MLAIHLHRHREWNPQLDPRAFSLPRWLAEFEDAFEILKPTDYGRWARAPQFRVELASNRVDRDRLSGTSFWMIPALVARIVSTPLWYLSK